MVNNFESFCCNCLDGNLEDNPVFACSNVSCGVTFHAECLGIPDALEKDLKLCKVCSAGENINETDCELCPARGGLLSRTESRKWVHIVCALYIPETYFGDVYTMEPIIIAHVPSERLKQRCYICLRKKRIKHASIGACITCAEDKCDQTFHVTCGHTNELLVERRVDVGSIKFVAYCDKHIEKKEPNIPKPIVNRIYNFVHNDLFRSSPEGLAINEMRSDFRDKRLESPLNYENLMLEENESTQHEAENTCIPNVGNNTEECDNEEFPKSIVSNYLIVEELDTCHQMVVNKFTEKLLISIDDTTSTCSNENLKNVASNIFFNLIKNYQDNNDVNEVNSCGSELQESRREASEQMVGVGASCSNCPKNNQKKRKKRKAYYQTAKQKKAAQRAKISNNFCSSSQDTKICETADNVNGFELQQVNNIQCNVLAIDASYKDNHRDEKHFFVNTSNEFLNCNGVVDENNSLSCLKQSINSVSCEVSECKFNNEKCLTDTKSDIIKKEHLLEHKDKISIISGSVTNKRKVIDHDEPISKKYLALNYNETINRHCKTIHNNEALNHILDLNKVTDKNQNMYIQTHKYNQYHMPEHDQHELACEISENSHKQIDHQNKCSYVKSKENYIDEHINCSEEQIKYLKLNDNNRLQKSTALNMKPLMESFNNESVSPKMIAVNTIRNVESLEFYNKSSISMPENDDFVHGCEKLKDEYRHIDGQNSSNLEKLKKTFVDQYFLPTTKEMTRSESFNVKSISQNHTTLNVTTTDSSKFNSTLSIPLIECNQHTCEISVDRSKKIDDNNSIVFRELRQNEFDEDTHSNYNEELVLKPQDELFNNDSISQELIKNVTICRSEWLKLNNTPSITAIQSDNDHITVTYEGSKDEYKHDHNQNESKPAGVDKYFFPISNEVIVSESSVESLNNASISQNHTSLNVTISDNSEFNPSPISMFEHNHQQNICDISVGGCEEIDDQSNVGFVELNQNEIHENALSNCSEELMLNPLKDLFINNNISPEMIATNVTISTNEWMDLNNTSSVIVIENDHIAVIYEEPKDECKHSDNPNSSSLKQLKQADVDQHFFPISNEVIVSESLVESLNGESTSQNHTSLNVVISDSSKFDSISSTSMVEHNQHQNICEISADVCKKIDDESSGGFVELKQNEIDDDTLSNCSEQLALKPNDLFINDTMLPEMIALNVTVSNNEWLDLNNISSMSIPEDDHIEVTCGGPMDEYRQIDDQNCNILKKLEPVNQHSFPVCNEGTVAESLVESFYDGNTSQNYNLTLNDNKKFKSSPISIIKHNHQHSCEASVDKCKQIYDQNCVGFKVLQQNGTDEDALSNCNEEFVLKPPIFKNKSVSQEAIGKNTIVSNNENLDNQLSIFVSENSNLAVAYDMPDTEYIHIEGQNSNSLEQLKQTDAGEHPFPVCDEEIASKHSSSLLVSTVKKVNNVSLVEESEKNENYNIDQSLQLAPMNIVNAKEQLYRRYSYHNDNFLDFDCNKEIFYTNKSHDSIETASSTTNTESKSGQVQLNPNKELISHHKSFVEQEPTRKHLIYEKEPTEIDFEPQNDLELEIPSKQFVQQLCKQEFVPEKIQGNEYNYIDFKHSIPRKLSGFQYEPVFKKEVVCKLKCDPLLKSLDDEEFAQSRWPTNKKSISQSNKSGSTNVFQTTENDNLVSDELCINQCSMDKSESTLVNNKNNIFSVYDDSNSNGLQVNKQITCQQKFNYEKKIIESDELISSNTIRDKKGSSQNKHLVSTEESKYEDPDEQLVINEEFTCSQECNIEGGSLLNKNVVNEEKITCNKSTSIIKFYEDKTFGTLFASDRICEGELVSCMNVSLNKESINDVNLLNKDMSNCEDEISVVSEQSVMGPSSSGLTNIFTNENNLQEEYMNVTNDFSFITQVENLSDHPSQSFCSAENIINAIYEEQELTPELIGYFGTAKKHNNTIFTQMLRLFSCDVLNKISEKSIEVFHDTAKMCGYDILLQNTESNKTSVFENSIVDGSSLSTQSETVTVLSSSNCDVVPTWNINRPIISSLIITSNPDNITTAAITSEDTLTNVAITLSSDTDSTTSVICAMADTTFTVDKLNKIFWSTIERRNENDTLLFEDYATDVTTTNTLCCSERYISLFVPYFGPSNMNNLEDSWIRIRSFLTRKRNPHMLYSQAVPSVIPI